MRPSLVKANVRHTKMTQIEIPPFDAIIGSAKPTGSFGDILKYEEHEKAISEFENLVLLAKEAVREDFNLNLSDFTNAADELDNIILEMWSEGWNPENGDLNLFCSHFGAVLASLLIAVPNTKFVFRSSTELDNLSIWHEPSKTEYFPFHKIAKCLTVKHGESVRQMVNDLNQKEFGEHGA